MDRPTLNYPTLIGLSDNRRIIQQPLDHPTTLHYLTTVGLSDNHWIIQQPLDHPTTIALSDNRRII